MEIIEHLIEKTNSIQNKIDIEKKDLNIVNNDTYTLDVRNKKVDKIADLLNAQNESLILIQEILKRIGDNQEDIEDYVMNDYFKKLTINKERFTEYHPLFDYEPFHTKLLNHYLGINKLTKSS